MTDKLEAILDKHRRDSSTVVGILQDIQNEFNYLPKEVLIELSHRLDVPLSQVYSVATFFRAFSLKPRGRHQVTVCLGTACHVRGGQRLLEKLERDLGIEAGETTADLNFTLNSVNCLGACALGPLVVIDGKYEGQMTTSKLDKVMKRSQ